MEDDDDILFGPLPQAIIPPTLDFEIHNRVKNPDGSISTVRTLSFNDGKGEVLIPTVVDGKILSDDDAIAHAQRYGENFGTYRTVEDADLMARFLHTLHAQRLAQETNKNGN